MRYVLDASVAALFVLHQALSSKADEMLERYRTGHVELYGPELMWYEVGNAVLKAVIKKYVRIEEAINNLILFAELGFQPLSVHRNELQKILTLAVEFNISYYDAIYVYATVREKISLLTADDGLLDRVGGKIPVVHLRDI